MADKISMSLDDIIASDQSGRSEPGRNFGGRSFGSGFGPLRSGSRERNRRASWQSRSTGGGPSFRSSASSSLFNSTRGDRSFFGGQARSAERGGQNDPAQLIISNLDFGVTDADIKELFMEFGPVIHGFINHDNSGKSMGTAEVVFQRRVDATRAMRQYNNISLDGKPMEIRLVTASRELNQDRSTRIGRSRNGVAEVRFLQERFDVEPMVSRLERDLTDEDRGGFSRDLRDRSPIGSRDRPASGYRDRSPAGFRGRSPARFRDHSPAGFRGRRGGRGRRDDRPVKTAEELDAELDDYISQKVHQT